MHTLLLMLLLVAVGVALVGALWSNFDFISFRDMYHSGPMAYDLRVSRISRRQFGVSGTVTMAADIMRYRTDGLLRFAPRPGAPYGLFPLYISPRDICVSWNEVYARYAMRQLANCSDLPQVDSPGPELCEMFSNVSFIFADADGGRLEYLLVCQFMQRTFTLTNYTFDPEPIPKMLQFGIYKYEVRILEDSRPVSGLEVIFQLS